VLEGGPDAYFSTLPVRAMADAVAAAGIGADVSNTAGTFVCNDTLYGLLHLYAGTSVRVGFIHVPFLPQQGQPSMELEQISKGLEVAIGAL